ncbi:MAG: BON domain-containing protein [Bdellovibrio sp.]|nr:BON domain-containing protein [Bdellovibrio sp.]
MYSKNRTQQNDSMTSQGFNRQGPQQGSAGRFNRSNHDTTGFQNFGQDQQAQRQQGFSGGYQSSQNSPYNNGQDDMNSSRTQNSSQWQQHEGPSYSAYGTNGGVYDTNSSTMGRGDANAYGTSSTGYGSSSGMGYGQGQHSDWSRAGSDRMGHDFSERQGYHPSRSSNEGMYKSDSYSSSGMPQSSEQIGSRYYGDQSGQQYGGARSQQYGASQGSYGAGQMRNNYGSASYGQGSQYGSHQSTQGVWGAPNTQSLYGEHNGKGPKNYRRSDDRVREDVSEALAHHGGIDASEVEVSVSEGVVTLSGTIESRQMKRMIEESIEHMSGVQDIKNELKVEESSASKRSSAYDTSSTEGSRSLSGSSTSMKDGKMGSASSTNGRTPASSSTSAPKQ